MHIRRFPEMREEIEAVYRDYVIPKKVLPSMRLLQFSGEAAEKNMARGFNCSYLPIDDWEAFSEVMFLLLSGCGVGYSVQSDHVDKLPDIKRSPKQRRYLIGDSIEGWADAIRVLMRAYFEGRPRPRFDYRDIRSKGTYLVTSGGKAPGPEPLRNCIHNITNILERKKNGEKLTPFEVHEIICLISDAVLAGGVRRCLSEDSRVLVRGKSFVHIRDIVVGDEVSTPRGWRKVVRTFDQGEQSVKEISFKNGSIKATKNHRFARLTGTNSFEWVQVKDLSPGDDLVFIPNFDEGKKTQLPPESYVVSDKVTVLSDIVLPEVDEELAWLIGVIHADGYVYLSDTHGSVKIACNSNSEEEYLEKIERIFSRFGVRVKTRKIKNENTIVFSAFSRRLASWFFENVKQPNTSIEIPRWIKEASPSVKLAYAQGVACADGSLAGRPMLLATSVYPAFIRDLQSLLYSCGIVTRMGGGDKRKPENWQPLFTLSVINKKDKEHFSKPVVYLPPLPTVRMARNTDCYKKSILCRDDFINEKFPNNNDRIACHHLKTEWIPQTITKVIDTPKKVHTFDIEVEGEHCFVVDGVLSHNSATICLFDVDDHEMLECKTGNWWETKPHLARANNSAVFVRHKIDRETYDRIFDILEKGGSGEPGFFLTNDSNIGTNPCAEISLSPQGFCNLTEINANDLQTQEDLEGAAQAAAFLGTIQASYTDFHYLRDEWKRTAEKEALLGVSMTGIASIYNRRDEFDFPAAVQVALDENERVAKLIGIKPARRVTTVKPAGTTSLVLGTSSGVHAWHSRFYVRRMRFGKDEAIAQYLHIRHPEIIEDEFFRPTTQSVVAVPVRAPEGAITREDESALDVLERLRFLHENWIRPGHRKGSNTHNVSCTINVRPEEWATVREWMWEHRDSYSAISILPYDGGNYQQAPFEEITEEEYNRLVKHLSDVDLTQVVEMKDETNLQNELACAGGLCEIT